MALWLALVLAASPDAGKLPAIQPRVLAPVWTRPLVRPDLLDWRPDEPGGPAVDARSGIVVVGTRDGVLRAFESGGTEAWSFQARGGFGAAPLVDDGNVYAGSDDGTVYALDLYTGKELWRQSIGEETGAQPVALKGILVIATHQDAVLALDARSGERKWSHRRERKGESFSIRGVARPLPAHGLLFAAYSDGTVSALDPQTGNARWERVVSPKGEQQDVDSLSADGSRIFAAAYAGSVLALEPGTGRTLWEQKLPAACQVLAVDGLVVAAAPGKLTGLDAAEGAVRWTAAIDPGSPGRLARVGGRVAVPTAKGLVLVAPLGGKVAEQLDPGSGVSAPPAIAGKRAYLLSNAGSLVAAQVE